MPYRLFSLEEVADYLHLTPAAVHGLLKDGAIPAEKRGDRYVFAKREIDAWASQRILGLPRRSLSDYHQQSTSQTRTLLPHVAILADLIEPGFIEPALRAKTKASVLQDMTALADRTGRVCDARELLASLQAREALCSTGLPGGLALLHPRHHQPYMFESSFLAVGRTVQAIHFGAPDGQPTHLFVLVCCQDDRLHLHTLARLCLMVQQTAALDRLRTAPDAAAMHAELLAAEAEVLAAAPPASRRSAGI